MNIIGLVGWIGCGKGTVADILVEKHGFKKESFANGVKDATAVVFGWERHMLEGDTSESRAWRENKDEYWSKMFGYDFSPRLALQLMGTEAGRNVFHTNLWVYTTLMRCERMAKNAENTQSRFVIADVRFPNEIKEIQNRGGIVVRVKRGPDPDWVSKAYNVNESTDWDGSIQKIHGYDVHYSEWAWVGMDFDHTIYNNGTLDELETQVKVVAERFESVYRT